MNDETIKILSEQAIIQAEMGCDVIAPSDMMDGRIGLIRTALDKKDFKNVQILSYAAKYASNFYGPFRDAIGSKQKNKIDKKTYQMDYKNSNEALREVALDIKEGADCIKITATGGSTKTSFPFRPSFNVDEMKAIVNEAHKFGKHTAAHCVSLQGIKNALDAGIDTLIHCVFLDAEGAAAPDLDVVKRIAEQGIYVNPTLSQSLVSIKNLEEKSELTPEEQKLLNQMKGKKGTNHRQPRIDETKKMVEMGIKLIAGSDASWQYYPMGGFQYELESFVYEVGLTPMEAIVSATRDGARSLWIDKEIGTLEKGKKADILIVDGDPSKDIKKLWNIEEVFLGGNPVLPTDNTIR